MSGMARAPSLPVVVASGPPTVDAVRRQLGGRAQSGSGVGAIVVVSGAAGAATGVVVHTDAAEAHVYVPGGFLRRAAHAELAPHTEPDATLSVLAEDARAFAALAEGEDVTFEDRGGRRHSGRLVEKCRYGAIVLTGNDRLQGVGFRRVRPGARS